MIRPEERTGSTETRRFGRHRIMLAVNLYSVHGETAGALLDLSRGGAMLSASPPLPIGCRLLIERHEMDVPGVVRWVNGNRFGVQFDTLLTEPELDALITKVEAAQARMAEDHAPAMAVSPSSASAPAP
jgi:hypothetical protein